MKKEICLHLWGVGAIKILLFYLAKYLAKLTKSQPVATIELKRPVHARYI